MKWKSVLFCGGVWILLTALLLALLYRGGMFRNGLAAALPIGLAVIAFTAFMFDILLGTRPRRIEKETGILRLYNIHAVFAAVGILAAAYHVYLRYDWGDSMTSIPFLTGMPAFLLFLAAVLTGIFVLSTTFVKYSAFLTNLKETKFNRESGLLIHRLVMIAFVLVYLHAVYFGFVRNNTPFMIVFTIYFAGTLLIYYVYKLKILTLPKYRLTSIRNLTRDVYEIEMEPADGNVLSYRAGEFAFFRPVKSALPFEAHPFTMTSSPLNKKSVSMMIKESGDFTNQISKLKVGDSVTLEGPYGNLFSEAAEAKETPVVMLAGGIGITPMISIFHYLLEMKSKREIVLFWSASTQADIFDEAYYNELNDRLSNFNLKISLSKEDKDGYLYGRISHKQFEETNMTHYYETADFFVCGPPKMLSSMIDMLKEQKVNKNRIHVEEFGF
ncbi:Na(+)-translocating NADH-quinone reductase subunit F [Methanimicrococcus sp. At1]|uniref:Na(+)-translocating NADH-quinone reductase subunit F n=1 Tax=Methanimicrococcus hacksteinii TaxID=3028293 RepID=A0ABU3VNP0_9EURY|nr:FAD-binding oxidoreductase [Methanimicrococcus sp. At1]MDV0445020.1 Na(+)-translocating NADH-quinone reductase subunit F [Methanimicrococcus sp. At1]